MSFLEAVLAFWIALHLRDGLRWVLVRIWRRVEPHWAQFQRNRYWRNWDRRHQRFLRELARSANEVEP